MSTGDALEGWNVWLALFLVNQILDGDDWVGESLAAVALEATARVLGPAAAHLPGSKELWGDFRRELVSRQPQMGPASTTAEQDAAAAVLEAQNLPSFALYFGAAKSPPRSSGDLPARLRLAHSSEGGTPLDVLIATRAGDRNLSAEIVAYIQEWGWLVDRLGREPTMDEYAERWGVSLSEARERNNRFSLLFTGEENPQRIWNLLWSDAETGSFLRLIGRAVVENDPSPSVLNRFVNCLLFELADDRLLGKAVASEIVTFEERTAGDPEREQRRFFALAERVRLWSAQVLSVAERRASLEGLLSLEGIFDGQSAAMAAAKIGDYRRSLPEGVYREALLAAQKCLRIAATLDALHPPASTDPMLPGVEWAAKTLAKLRDTQIDLVAEARTAVRMVDSVN